jgi:hypothetical protein
VAQKRDGLSWIKPKTAGSDPMGISVAEMNETKKTVLKPNSGSARSWRMCWNQSYIKRSEYGLMLEALFGAEILGS